MEKTIKNAKIGRKKTNADMSAAIYYLNALNGMMPVPEDFPTSEFFLSPVNRGARIATNATIQIIETQFLCHQDEPNQAKEFMTEITMINPITIPPQKNVGIHSRQFASCMNNPERIKITTNIAIPIPSPGKSNEKN